MFEVSWGMTKKLQHVQVLNWYHFCFLWVQNLAPCLVSLYFKWQKNSYIAILQLPQGGAVTTAPFLTTKNLKYNTQHCFFNRRAACLRHPLIWYVRPCATRSTGHPQLRFNYRLTWFSDTFITWYEVGPSNQSSVLKLCRKEKDLKWRANVAKFKNENKTSH